MKKKINLIVAAVFLTLILTNPSKDDIVTQLNKSTYTADSASTVARYPLFHWHDVYDNPVKDNFIFLSFFRINHYMERTCADSVKYPRIRTLIHEENYFGLLWKCYKISD